MGLFDKKYCDICGEKIGLLGNRKLEDGNMCKECAKLLSPWMTDRRGSTVEEIKEHLAYREQNRSSVEAFNVTRVIGSGYTKIYFDEDASKWMVTGSRKWKEENPDILDFSQVTGCNLNIDENRSEIKRTDSQGNEVSYNPPRYEYSYDFDVIIHVNSPWFSEIKFRLNQGDIEGRGSVEYNQCMREGDEIKKLLSGLREQARQASAPKTSVICPHCGASTVPDDNGCCEYCCAPIG